MPTLTEDETFDKFNEEEKERITTAFNSYVREYEKLKDAGKLDKLKSKTMETTTTTVAETKWVFDASHSELSFKVKHLMVTNVKGDFRKFNVEMNGAEVEGAKVKVTVDADSIDMGGEPNREGHLRAPDFFDVANHKEIVFESTSFKRISGENFSLVGNLTIKGISKEVKLEVEFLGMLKDPWGNQKAAFSVTGKVKRSEWGLNWNAALETGGVLVSDEVRIFAEIQLLKQTN